MNNHDSSKWAPESSYRVGILIPSDGKVTQVTLHDPDFVWRDAPDGSSLLFHVKSNNKKKSVLAPAHIPLLDACYRGPEVW